MSYTIRLPQFEGPFDLLLFFIERDELDIYNIPIATITDDFLAYVREMEALNIDLASEFILVAATLMRIKAKMLLPRRDKDEAGNEIDPREELVERLLEYKRYKSVLDELRELESRRAERETRGNAVDELQAIANRALADAELESLTLFKLLKTFQRLMEKMEDANKAYRHRVVQYNYTIEAQKASILQTVQQFGRVDFEIVFAGIENRVHAFFQFLAMLELIQLQSIRITVGEGTNNFWLAVPSDG